jgi:hypothetical protein
MQLGKLLISFVVLMVGLCVAGTGLYLLIARAGLDYKSTIGLFACGLLVTGLLLVGVAGSLYRAGGGVDVNPRRRRWRLGDREE